MQDWTPPAEVVGPPPRRRRVVLTIVGIAVVALLVLATAGYAAWRLTRPGIPAGWASLTVAVSPAGDEDTRRDAGTVLAERVRELGAGNASVEVTDAGFRLGVPSAGRAALDRLAGQLPLDTAVAVRAVTPPPTGSPGGPGAVQQPSPVPSTDNCAPRQDSLCDLRQHTRYRLGETLMGGEHVREATAVQDPQQGWLVRITFDGTGTSQLAHATANQVGRQMAIVATGTVLMAPQVQAAITAGALQISGGLTKAQAEQVAAAMRLGRHPVRLSR